MDSNQDDKKENVPQNKKNTPPHFGDHKANLTSALAKMGFQPKVHQVRTKTMQQASISASAWPGVFSGVNTNATGIGIAEDGATPGTSETQCATCQTLSMPNLG